MVGFTAVSLAEIPERPQPQRLVNDFASVLSKGRLCITPIFLFHYVYLLTV